MAFDYAPILADAQALVAEFGRPVVFVRLDRSPADAAKPWRSSTDPRAAVDATVAVNIVQVDPRTSDEELGFKAVADGAIDRDVRAYIAAPPAGGQALDTFDEVLDGVERFKIRSVGVLRPATTTLLYIVRCER
jgi:hypothetical protein